MTVQAQKAKRMAEEEPDPVSPEASMTDEQADPGPSAPDAQSSIAQSTMTYQPAPAKEEPFSLVQTIRDWLSASFGAKSEETLREALEEVMDEHAEDGVLINPEARLMLNNLLRFGELEVSDAMIHRSDVVAVSDKITLEDLRTVIIRHGHTRMPVFSDNLDTIIGLIHSKDLIPYIGNESAFEIGLLVRPIMAVPPTMKVVDLLVKMRSNGTHMALVVDEYGGTDGVVTLEDLFEKIVGDIHDEYDEDEKERLIEWTSANRALVDARIDLHELESQLNQPLAIDEAGEDDFDTLGGLLFSLFGKVPAQGESVRHRGFIFTIESADARRIFRVTVERVSQPVTAQD